MDDNEMDDNEILESVRNMIQEDYQQSSLEQIFNLFPETEEVFPETLYLTKISVRNEVIKYHLSVFKETYGVKTHTVRISNSNNNILAFETRRDIKTFNKWYKDYSARFSYKNEINNSHFPSLPKGTVKITVINTGISEALEHWKWIVKSTDNDVWWINGVGWAFSKVNDAILFKLRFNI